MGRVYIAEKPSLARAIAAVLPEPHRRCDGYISVGNGDVVTWCIGHLLEQVPPDAYDARYKRWNIEDLPIVPSKWRLAPRSSARKQLAVLRKLLAQAPGVVHAGDPDREGQLLVDEVIDYLGYPIAKRREIERLLISDLNPAAVRRALGSLKANRDYAPLSVSALARSRADWLYGMNMSRAYTLLGQRAGYDGVLSVGRVQTPVLGLVVRRDEEIENFVSKPYYLVDALIPHEGNDIRGRWQPSEACKSFQDEEGRVLHRPLAENVCARIKGQPANITESEHKDIRQSAPLPYSLSALQIDCSKRYGMTAANVLSACQGLYEKHKAITYPRSDCRHLPQEHHSEAPEVIRAIATTAPALANAAGGSNTALCSKAWDDGKVSAHHAIIPTPSGASGARFSDSERKVYELIARQYLMQFYPQAVYALGKLVFEIAGGTFVAKGRMLKEAGWRALLGGSQAPDKEKGDLVPSLPKGTTLICREGKTLDKKTEPPKAFTEATLLQAMTGIARFVADAALRKILKETDGLGTEATRSGIIENLVTKVLLRRDGKNMHATPAGRGLIHALPESAAFPDMTAHWERKLCDIAESKDTYQLFMQALESDVAKLMASAKGGGVPESLRGLKAPPKRRNSKPSRSRKRRSRS
ncbi:MAG: DNA topoisomerase III [Myxococcales bacterium]|nr:DNA topoisomerase III [Myxococcales bacterium]